MTMTFRDPTGRRIDPVNNGDDVGTCALCGHVYTGRLPNKLMYDDPVNPALLERRLHIIADAVPAEAKAPNRGLVLDVDRAVRVAGGGGQRCEASP